MLRLLVLLMLLANGAYFAWVHGHLLPWGYGPAQQAEPQRMAQQLRPEAARVLKAEDLKRIENAVAASPRGPDCLQTGVLDEPRVLALRPLLEAWPAGTWALEEGVEPARWIIYMGRYANVDQVARKRAELRQIGVSFESVGSAELEPGLSLGGFASQSAAQQQLDALTNRGVRTARVVQERPEQRGQRLTLPLVDDTLRARIDELRAPLAGRALRACR